MKKLILGFIVSLFSVVSYGQNTVSVTGTVIDSDSQAWFYSTVTATLVNPAGGNPVYKSGGTVPKVQTYTLSNTGAFSSATIPNNAQIVPLGTTWSISICSFTAAPCQTIPNVSITGAMNLGTYISANIIAPRFKADKNTGVFYNDNEPTNPVNGNSGIEVSVISGNLAYAQATYQNGTWTLPNPVNGGSPSGAAGGDLSGTYPNPNVAKINGGIVPVSQPCIGTNSSGQPISGTCGSVTTSVSTATIQPPSAQIVPSVWTCQISDGDSITQGANASPSSANYVNLLATYAGTSACITNAGIAGSTAGDMVEQQVFNDNPVAGDGKVRTAMIGTNEALDYGINYPTGGNYQLFHQSALSWKSTPSSLKTQAGNCTLGTGVTADTHFSTITGATSTTNASTITCNFTAPTTSNFSTIAIWYPVIQGNGGSMTWSISGVSGGIGSFNNFTSFPCCGSFVTRSVGVAFASLQGMSSGGSYTIIFTVSSPTGSGNVAAVYGFGFNQPTAPAATDPQIWSAGVPRIQSDGALSTPASTLQQASDLYDYLAREDVRILQQYGFPVYWVNVRNYLSSIPSVMGNSVPGNPHPTNPGHAQIALAFESPTATPQWDSRSINFTTGGYTSPGVASLGFSANIDPTYTGQIVQVGGGTYTGATCSTSVIFLYAVTTVDLNMTCGQGPNINTAKSIYIYNSNGAPSYVYATPPYNSYSIPANTGVLFMDFGSSGWLPMFSPSVITSGTFGSATVTVNSSGQVSGVAGINPTVTSTTLTPGTNVISSTCTATGGCNQSRGSILSVTNASFTTGNIFTYTTLPLQTSVPNCIYVQNGAPTAGVAGATTGGGFTISATIASPSSSISVSWQCEL